MLADGAGATTTKAFSITIGTPPTITSLNPASRGQGATNQSITVTGTGFQSGAVVTFSGSGVTATTAFNSATQLTLSLTVTSGAATGARNVTVTNPDGGTFTLNNGFTVNAGPTITSLSPNVLGQGAAGKSVVLTGTGLVSGATVSFSGAGVTATTAFNSATQLTLTVTVTSGAATGARNVTVTNPDGGTFTLTNGLTVNAAPTILSITPNTHAANSNGVAETITGTGFQPGATVTFTGSNQPTVASTITVNGPGTQLTFTINIPKKASGAYSVVVTNPDGGTATLANGFTAT